MLIIIIDFAVREATSVINKTTTIIINWLPELVVPLGLLYMGTHCSLTGNSAESYNTLCT